MDAALRVSELRHRQVASELFSTTHGRFAPPGIKQGSLALSSKRRLVVFYAALAAHGRTVCQLSRKADLNLSRGSPLPILKC